MGNRILKINGPQLGWILAAILLIGAAPIVHARGGFVSQLVPFYFSNGSEVISINGEPDDAVLNRFYDMQKERINWQFMTQYLAPGKMYDIWLEGTNNGADSFSWWVGRAKATPRGDLNANGTVYVNQQPGPGVGEFTNPLAQAHLVIRTTAGVTVQIAFFPVP
jgi:hypothetical protein